MQLASTTLVLALKTRPSQASPGHSRPHVPKSADLGSAVWCSNSWRLSWGGRRGREGPPGAISSPTTESLTLAVWVTIIEHQKKKIITCNITFVTTASRPYWGKNYTEDFLLGQHFHTTSRVSRLLPPPANKKLHLRTANLESLSCKKFDSSIKSSERGLFSFLLLLQQLWGCVKLCELMTFLKPSSPDRRRACWAN